MLCQGARRQQPLALEWAKDSEVEKARAKEAVRAQWRVSELALHLEEGSGVVLGWVWAAVKEQAWARQSVVKKAREKALDSVLSSALN